MEHVSLARSTCGGGVSGGRKQRAKARFASDFAPQASSNTFNLTLWSGITLNTSTSALTTDLMRYVLDAADLDSVSALRGENGNRPRRVLVV